MLTVGLDAWKNLVRFMGISFSWYTWEQSCNALENKQLLQGRELVRKEAPAFW